ncbi:hypothetical protein B0J12DRAFT_738396 [Macrophomina phaseolina]|uniref:Myb-like domain-containing protein n=1 Tax=Macrophomina phaseolina TaxID=35725 RepID=A0ABQ8GGT1_9PEZI|nr:hypothetical protein B0J12DRAFT_738396 [Macrophomina phaseolina]
MLFSTPPRTDIRKIDPDWARKHRFTMWGAGYSRRQVRKHIAQPGFAAQRAAKKAESAVEKKRAGEATANEKEKAKKEEPKPVVDSKKESPKQAADKVDSRPATGKKKDSKPAAPNKNDSGTPDFTFTDEEDKQLLELKDKGETWKAIAQTMKKPQGLLKKRFNEIASDEQKNAGQKGAGKKENSSQGKANDNRTSPASAKSKGPTTQSGPKSGASNRNSDDEWEIRTVTDPGEEDQVEYFILYPDENFSEQEAKMARAIYEDFDNYFLRISSRFQDYTGRQVSPDIIQRFLSTSKKKELSRTERLT